jgi:hypothetical protein
VVALRSGLLPTWLAWAGFVAAVVALLRYFGPLGGWLALAWIVIVSILMLAGSVGRAMAAARA